MSADDTTVLYNEVFYALFESGLRTHARESNGILLRWAQNKISKKKGVPKKWSFLPEAEPCTLARMNAVLMDFPTVEVVEALLNINDMGCPKTEEQVRIR
jgi:hypothetical protein